MGVNTAEAMEVGDQDLPTYATSLQVPNVQEMVRKNPLHVPERYIRNQEDMPKNTDMTHLSCEIPVIDLSLLSKGHEEELKNLELACEEMGLFSGTIQGIINFLCTVFRRKILCTQVVNHGVAEQVLQGLKQSAAESFELSLEEKDKYAMASDDIQGYGHAYVVSEEQKLDRERIEQYSSEVKRVGEELLCSVSLIMGMHKDTLLGQHKELVQALRVNYYPTCSIPDEVLGISPHSDTSIITIVMQDDNITGLQIKHDGHWVPVKPIPNTLVVNVGDVIETRSRKDHELLLRPAIIAMTDSEQRKYRSIEHRVVTNKNRARISFASFIVPHDEVEIEPFDHMVDCQQPLKIYKKIKYGDYLRHSLKRKMEGKAHTEMAKNEN